MKDRIGVAMIREAERGRIAPDRTVLVEPDGNTGIALAMVAARSYRLILIMPHDEHQRRSVQAYGQTRAHPRLRGMKVRSLNQRTRR